jgi:sulfur-oxidizing protein SoxY
MKRTLGALAASCLVLAAATARAEESEASRAARWKDVAAALFQGKTVQDGSAILQLDAPPRALDAALVPVTITVDPKTRVAALYLVIDDNPAPLAGAFHFGPAADPHLLKTRVRVDQYTLMHAVAQLQDGSLYSVAKFVKAAGGCSAPGSTGQAEAMARIGRMKLLVRDREPAGGTETAELLISHPNNNGMQMDQVTRLYTPARFVQNVVVSQAGQLIFRMDGDISLSQDPAITFGFHPVAGAAVNVEVDDSAHAVFKQSFPTGTGAS